MPSLPTPTPITSAGGFAGMEIAGVTELLRSAKPKSWCTKRKRSFSRGSSPSDMIKSDNGDKIDVGGVEIQLMHTPGHTPGSQCFLVDDRIVSGDTMFIDACGRVDFPGGNPEQMYYSLTQKLMALPDETILFPGHNYARSTARDDRRAEKDQSLPKILFVETVLSGDGLSLIVVV